MRHDFRMSEMDLGGGAAPTLRGHFLYNEPMSKHVSWRAGGDAQRVYIPADLDDLSWLVRSLPAHEEIHMLGLGSNLLVRDGGVTGVVILLHGVLKKLAIESRTQGMPPAPIGRDTALIYAQAGVASPKLARFAANNNLVGGEFWAGIPGTVGGAIAMNAGCYGGETWDKLVQVLTLNRQGQLNERLPGEYVTGYRHVALKQPHQEWFVGGWFRLEKGDGAASRETIKTLLKQRIASQPLNLPNAGSVFRNPPGDHAARLIESCGLKGFRIGDAQVSEKHANFIVNLGHACAADIERLIEHVEDSVEARTNVRLIREVRIIGERQ
ncbi:MAG TPA: UDP-N-acetylmuramate dehydrogenase [Thiobacillus sp.]|nr:MAG: UDP-N-acetylenolpyruvoylglucosamine reductase [Hydrogenophilales bacterium 16-61-112]OZA45908.1 MAG: UDP-N-acetylenolpyruvoylglucosamine reductase [Hydrogenophilales bacterium 17-61-76]HQT29693.1 UDP-N-acetylmuramate dehydrogenase [Thiobacillus sp.]HQT70462.1 UDP-N-acetylmuramate dehydrogenase [Thiobacillus sp.]